MVFATATALVFAVSPARASNGETVGAAKVASAVAQTGAATDFSAARRHRHYRRHGNGGAAAAAAFAGIVGTIGAIAAAQARRDAYYDGPYGYYGGGPYYASPYYGRPYYGGYHRHYRHGGFHGHRWHHHH
jgi:hypothetical protein